MRVSAFLLKSPLRLLLAALFVLVLGVSAGFSADDWVHSAPLKPPAPAPNVDAADPPAKPVAKAEKPVKSPGMTRDGKLKFYDFYLKGDRVCTQCAAQWIDSRRVAFTNKAGEYSVVEAKEIIGFDKHPLGRKLLLHSIHNIGPSGPTIAPYAFNDYKDYTCKYCDSFSSY